MFSRLLVAIAATAISYFLLKYRQKIGDLIGPVGFAEKFFGGGGTYTLLVIIAIVIFFLGLSYLSGGLDFFFQQSVSPYFGGK